jgi:hypothetical protein
MITQRNGIFYIFLDKLPFLVFGLRLPASLKTREKKGPIQPQSGGQDRPRSVGDLYAALRIIGLAEIGATFVTFIASHPLSCPSPALLARRRAKC